MSIFQIVILIVFGLFAGIGFVFLATYSPSPTREQFVGDVIIWGTLDADIVDSLLKKISLQDDNFKNVTYVEKSLATFNHELLEAMAFGNSPDLFLVSNRDIFKNLNKIFLIDSQTYSIRDYKNTFANAFSIFTTSQGILAIPFLIDPMVMYYNKDIFATAAVPLPPVYWEEFYDLSKKITQLDYNKNIKKATIAFGETINVTNFKYIIATMMLQLGNPIVYESENGFTTTVSEKSVDLAPILTYYTSFSDPTAQVYSWNRSLPESLNFFLAGSLATYFGFVSELKNIHLKNPNLNFDVAEMPAPRGVHNKTVFARVWGFAIPKSSRNKDGAFKTALILSGETSQQYLSDQMFLPPVRKSMLANRHTDPFMDIFYRKAIYAQSFIDPNNTETTKIFKQMIDSVISGKSTPQQAVQSAFRKIDILLK